MGGEQCRWKGCCGVGEHSRVDRSGRTWSVLCSRHYKELDAVIASLDPKKLMRAWVLASGGAEKMAKG